MKFKLDFKTKLPHVAMTCETCNGKGYIHTAVYSHPTIPDGTERYEVCDECKHNKT